MKQKTLTIIFGMIFLVGILITGISADEEYIGTISNTTGIDISDFVAGSTTTANFSFDYEDSYEADKHYPLIFKINISYSGNDCQLEGGDCSVWKNDFEIEGTLRRYYFFGLYSKNINLECSEESPLIINHQMGSNTLDVPNGIFYCYNITEGTIEDLKKRNKVFLNIFSNPALYPATYKITAQMFYANDTIVPVVNIINKNIFEDNYFRESDSIEVQATISDNMEISNKWGTIFLTNENITVPFSHKIDNTYYFSQMTPSDIKEGDYELTIFAEDTSGNVGNDSTTLMIDRTPPEIELVEPVGIVSEEFSIKFNVTDEKAGVDNESVKIRLREIVNSQICPETGGVIGEGNFSCITTPWINLTLVNGLFEVDINTTELNLTSGEYWLDAVASDVLGNEAKWIA